MPTSEAPCAFLSDMCAVHAFIRYAALIRVLYIIVTIHAALKFGGWVEKRTFRRQSLRKCDGLYLVTVQFRQGKLNLP